MNKTIIHAIFFSLIIIFFNTSISQTKTPLIKSKKLTKKLIIDGDFSDWLKIEAQESLNGIIAQAAYDDDYVYIQLRTSDIFTKYQLLGYFKQDFTIWVSKYLTNNKKYGLRFTNNTGTDIMQFLRQTKTSDQKSIKNISNNFKIEFLKRTKAYEMVNSTKNIQIAEIADTLFYEIKIPLEDLNTKSKKNIYIYLETNPFDEKFLDETRNFILATDLIERPANKVLLKQIGKKEDKRPLKNYKSFVIIKFDKAKKPFNFLFK